jgi:hypothetical protein
MKSPHATGDRLGVGAWKSLGDDSIPSTEVGTLTQRRFSTLRQLDRQADLLLTLGRHRQAEYLAHRAEQLRMEIQG